MDYFVCFISSLDCFTTEVRNTQRARCGRLTDRSLRWRSDDKPPVIARPLPGKFFGIKTLISKGRGNLKCV